jgi:glycosyltransferase 2 family protein
MLVLVLAAVVVVVSRNRQAFIDTLDKVGVGGVVLSLAAALVGVAGTYLQWRSVLLGLGVRFGVAEGARVFFTSQLGKYLPGSVWPIVMQMEAGRSRGAARKTMLAANLVTVLLSVCVGVVLAGLLLPFSVPSALHRFWWALAALPLLLVLALPRSLPFMLDRLLKLLRRAPLNVQMSGSATITAAGWSALSWVAFGAHLAVLVAAIGTPSLGLLALCVGGMGLAVSAGVLFLPAPAGAGLREIVLGYVLVAVLTSGQVVAVVIASRVILLLADLLMAALVALTSPRRSHAMI